MLAIAGLDPGQLRRCYGSRAVVDLAVDVRIAVERGEWVVPNSRDSATLSGTESQRKNSSQEDAAAFDEVYTHILHMSDALSDGIIKQFPQRF